MKITRKQYEEAMTTGVAPSGCHFLAIATNTDGRPCGWGKAGTLAEAKNIADTKYDQHDCYPGEQRQPAHEVSIVDEALVDGPREFTVTMKVTTKYARDIHEALDAAALHIGKRGGRMNSATIK